MVQLQSADIQRLQMCQMQAAATKPLGMMLRMLSHKIEDATRAATLQLAARHSVLWRPHTAPLRDLSASSFHVEQQSS